MFTIEHDFDATVITLVDEGDDSTSPLQEDVIIEAYEECVVIRQVDQMTDEEFKIWCNYHYLVCREKSLMGASNHGLVIARKLM